MAQGLGSLLDPNLASLNPSKKTTAPTSPDDLSFQRLLTQARQNLDFGVANFSSARDETELEEELAEEEESLPSSASSALTAVGSSALDKAISLNISILQAKLLATKASLNSLPEDLSRDIKTIDNGGVAAEKVEEFAKKIFFFGMSLIEKINGSKDPLEKAAFEQRLSTITIVSFKFVIIQGSMTSVKNLFEYWNHCDQKSPVCKKLKEALMRIAKFGEKDTKASINDDPDFKLPGQKVHLNIRKVRMELFRLVRSVNTVEAREIANAIPSDIQKEALAEKPVEAKK